MTFPIAARGRLFHHFHGAYSATILLTFATQEERERGAKDLPRAAEWVPSEHNHAVIVWKGGRRELEDVKHALTVAFEPCPFPGCRGACAEEGIDGIAHSVDQGPAFVAFLTGARKGGV
jgi:hypothetical protein